MELKINVTTNDCCKVVVQDISEYLPEDFQETVKGKFKYSETVSIDVLQHNEPTETTYRNPVYKKHSDNNPSEINVDFDGWFTVVHIVLPSQEWFARELSKEVGSALGLYSLVYYSNGETIYKYTGETSVEVTIDEIMEVNPVNSTISTVEKDYVSICYLRKCYIKLCKQIFEDRGFNECWNKQGVDSELVFKRDLVWMAINVIKYHTQCNQLAEVARIISIINGCNGLCSNTKINSTINGCGCS